MLDCRDALVVVVDVQGKLAQIMTEKESLFKNCQVLVKAANKLEIPVLWCQQVPKALGPTIPEIADELVGLDPIDKSCFSCWGSSAFRERLCELDRNQVLLCGIEAHICVAQTALDCARHGFDVHWIGDAISSRTPFSRDAATQRVAQQGIQVASVEMVLFALLKDARHPCFRDIASLIK